MAVNASDAPAADVAEDEDLAGPAVDVQHGLRDDEPGEDEQLDESTAS